VSEQSRPDSSLTQRAQALAARGRNQDALDLYRQAAAESDSASLQDDIATTLLALKQPEAALEAAGRAIALDPESPTAHLTRSVILSSLGKAVEAQQAAEEAVRLDPESSTALLVLAEAQSEGGKHREAEGCAKRAVKAAPESAHTHAVLAGVFFRAKRYPEAEQAARVALSIDPEDVGTMNNLGAALRMQKKHSEAVEILHRAAQLDPSHEVVRENLLGAASKYGGSGIIFVLIAGRLIMASRIAFFNSVPWPLWVVLVILAITAPFAYRTWRLRQLDPQVLQFYMLEVRRLRNNRGLIQKAVLAAILVSFALALMINRGDGGTALPEFAGFWIVILLLYFPGRALLRRMTSKRDQAGDLI